AEGNTVVTCCIVHAPDKSFGSVLRAGFGCISGFNALTSRSSLSWAGVGVFLPKILESNVAILQFSLQSRALCVGDANAEFLSRRNIAVNMNFVVGPCPAEIALFNEYLLNCADEFRTVA